MSKLTWQDRLSQGDPTLRVHLVGIGGAGLSAIAQVLLEMNVQVSGSDRQPGATAQRLAAGGATVFFGQEAANLTQLPEPARPDVVLISSAIDAANPERQAAAELGIPIVKRDEFLPALLAERRLIAVAGTHGKTTTTAMTVQALRTGGVDCGYIVGTEVPGFGSGAAGGAPDFVLEADEYDRMFLGLRPSVAVVTNVEWDHPDCYPTPASFRRAFMQFTDAVDRNGMVVSCADDTGAEQVRAYAAKRGPRWITYGLAPHADLRAVNLHALPNEGTRADLVWWHAPAGELVLHVPGLHNVRNALAALAVATALDVPVPAALAALNSYRGTARRFEWKGEAGGVTVIDDYAHHPTEIRATLAAARSRYPDRRIWAVFQPHTFSRTRHMLYRMGESFEQADEVVVTDIYAAREVDDGSVKRARAGGRQSAPGDPPYRRTGCCGCLSHRTGAARRRAHHVGRRRRQPGWGACPGLPAGWRADCRGRGAALVMTGHISAPDAPQDLSTPVGLGIDLRRAVSLAPLTTMKVGGPAELFASVATLEQLAGLVRWAQAAGQPYCLLGGGSNVLISDAGIRGLVIFNRCRAVNIGPVADGSAELENPSDCRTGRIRRIRPVRDGGERGAHGGRGPPRRRRRSHRPRMGRQPARHRRRGRRQQRRRLRLGDEGQSGGRRRSWIPRATWPA